MTPFEKWLKNEVGISPKQVREDPTLKQAYEAIWSEMKKID